MKNKTRTYVLLAGVFAVWSIIGFKILSAINPDPPKATVPNALAAFKPEAMKATDTFSIRTVERDPFLGTLQHKKKSTISSKPIQPKPTFAWPEVVYQGSMAQQDSKERIYIVSIDGRQYLMSKGQTINGVTLVTVNASSATITSKGHRKTLPKS